MSSEEVNQVRPAVGPAEHQTPPRSCPACRSARARRAFTVRGHHFLRCRDCRSLYLIERPDPAELSQLYSGERYYANPELGLGAHSGYRDYLGDREEIKEKFDRILARLERLVPPGRLLDVGAGPGLLVAAAESRGWDARGLDLNPWAVDWGREQLGVEVEVGSLEEAELEPSSLDAVTMLDLIEHVADPERLIAATARALRIGGALVVFTPDAGSIATRALGARWPEVQRAGEHLTLFSLDGLRELLLRHSLEPLGWHTVGKRTSLATLASDLAPLAPAIGRRLARSLEGRPVGRRKLEIDPRAKVCLYARRVPSPARVRPARMPKREAREVESAIHEELEHLAAAERLCDWMFDSVVGQARGNVAEVGAGIGTFSARLLAAGAERLLLLEPEPSLAEELRRRFERDERVTVVPEPIPEAPSLRGGRFDLVLCQNVLEHVDDDEAAVAAMAAALRPGGRLALLVPADPGLFGPLDLSYGHRRRYTAERIEELLRGAGLTTLELRHFNLLGIPGWWAKNRRPGARVGPRALAAYEALLPLWRPLEERIRPSRGLSLIARAERPPD